MTYEAQPVVPEQVIVEGSLPQEKMLTQSQVNAVVAAEKAKAFQKGLEQGAAKSSQVEVPIETAPKINEEELITKAVSKMKSELDEGERIRKQNEERAEHERAFKEAVDKVNQRLEKAKEENPEIEESVKKFADVSGDDSTIQNFKGSALWLSSQFENSAEILSEISKDVAKQINLSNALKTSPQLALNYVKAISDSLKANYDAVNAPKAPKPLDRIVGTPLGGSGDVTSPAYWKAQKGYRK